MQRTGVTGIAFYHTIRQTNTRNKGMQRLLIGATGWYSHLSHLCHGHVKLEREADKRDTHIHAGRVRRIDEFEREVLTLSRRNQRTGVMNTCNGRKQMRETDTHVKRTRELDTHVKKRAGATDACNGLVVHR